MQRANASCTRCDADLEDVDHIFRQCPDSRSLWLHFRRSLPSLDNHISFDAWFLGLLRHRECTLGVAVLWWMWRWRNHRAFDGNHWTLNQILRNILRDVALWKKVMLHQPAHHSISATSSTPSITTGTVRLTTDGSWDPLLNQMGCAAVLWAGNGDWQSAISTSAGPGSAFLAEIAALELGLKHALDLRISILECYSDCLHMVTMLQSGSDTSTYWARDNITRIRSMMARF
ncbi:uncharacterized protein LOC130713397 [Lotus japonicus]|uniref:uncharacterized protein LOC130713397 n=1 Tax=Lotus japonicus TaxID=34305 RepID=UPI0025861CCC|nr:uncharacterized protein LOC130713397 [Lotus japonicus]